MIKRVSTLNEKLVKSGEKRQRQKKTDYVRLLQRRGCIKRYYLTKDNKLTTKKTFDGHNNFIAYDTEEFEKFMATAKVGRPKKEKL